MQGVAKWQPDVIALQEVRLPLNNAQWLADQLGGYAVSFVPKTKRAAQHEGLAILSRLPIEGEARLDLQSQSRVAQYIRLKINDQKIIVANVHLYWEPGESTERMKQVERLLEWLRSTPAEAVIIGGDFNSEPHHLTVKRLKKNFASAYETQHGAEPAYTCPTPLTSKKNMVTQTVKSMGQMFLNLKAHQPAEWRGTLDYIFVNDRVQVRSCAVVLNQAAAHDATLYPSDHFGLCADLDFRSL